MPATSVQFQFSGLHGRPGICAIERIALADGRTLIIASEVDENLGTSITNAAELIITQVCQRYHIDPAKLAWIEHYPPSKSHGEKADWDLVTFVFIRHGDHWHFEEPSWRPMRLEDWTRFGLAPRA
jgi:hypothetical protein